MSSPQTGCDFCGHYTYDDESGCWFCAMQLDEDEMFRFLRGDVSGCPYFQFDAEYQMVRKQN